MKFNLKKFKIFIKKISNKILIRKSSSQLFNSRDYWEKRYLSNNNSGAGSYGRLADFKAEVLNDFVKINNIQSIIEFGCGDGNQLGLANYPNYIGLDVSKNAISLCQQKFKEDVSKKFYLTDEFKKRHIKTELVLSLDVLFHLIEDEVFENYMNDIFNSATKYVIIYSSNYNDHFAPHVKCRKFTDWTEKNVSANWKLQEVINNIYPFDKSNPDSTSFSDFYIFKRC